jgi:hypothetical protein
MFENFLTILSVAIAISFLIYNVQLRIMLYRIFTKDYSRNSIKNLTAKFRGNWGSHLNSGKPDTYFIPPIFKKLKIIKNRNDIKFYFVNEGDQIFNLKIQPLGDFKVVISPEDKIGKNESGCIEIILFELTPPGEEIKFKLFYNNKNAEPQADIFCYSFINENIARVEPSGIPGLK